MSGGAETAPPGQASLDQRLLLQDAVDRVIANPSAAEGWITLVARTREVAQHGKVEGLAALLQQRVPASGVAGFSRQCFLGWLTGDLRHREQAGQVLLDLTPFDPDRACAFLHSMWQHGLQAATHRGVFERSLQAAQLPRIADVLGRQLARQLSLPGPVGSAGAVRKVALVAPALTSLQHPPTRMALDQAWVLARAGLVVELFSCQESSSAAFGALLAGTVRMDAQPVDTAGWADHVGAPVRLHQSDPRFSVHSRLRDMLPRVLASRPDAVLCVGLITGLAQALFERLPVVGLATNSVQPMLPCDVWLSAAAQPPAAPWDLSLPPSQAWHHPFRTRRRMAMGKHSRPSLGLPEQAVVLVTLSNPHYLAHLDADWVGRLAALMREHRQLVWLVAGGDAELAPALASIDSAQLRRLTVTDDAISLLQLSDLYLNPPQSGGGFSVAEAMAEGLPVLALAHSDGGDKLGDAAVPDIEAYFGLLRELLQSAEARRALGQRLRQRFDQQIDLAQSGPSLIGALALARSRFEQRQPAVDRKRASP